MAGGVGGRMQTDAAAVVRPRERDTTAVDRRSQQDFSPARHLASALRLPAHAPSKTTIICCATTNPTMATVGYVLRNPVRAGLVRRVGEHPFAGSDVYSPQELEEVREAD